MEKSCPKCNGETRVKNGIKYNKQRYKCKGCGCCYTQSKSRNYTFKIKYQALKLYLEGLGMRSIGRFLGVSNTTVLYWIRQFGTDLQQYVLDNQVKDIRHVDVVEMDEMWHFTQKKKGNSGYGLQLIAIHKSHLLYLQEVVERKHLNQ